MSVHTKAHHTRGRNYIDVRVGMPSGKEVSYHIPNSAKDKLNTFLKQLDVSRDDIASWDKATPWKELAKDRIEKYKKAGLVLRGARYRENFSQVKLAKKTGISQDVISKIENGKRTVGEKVARRLAKALNFDYRLLLEQG